MTINNMVDIATDIIQHILINQRRFMMFFPSFVAICFIYPLKTKRLTGFSTTNGGLLK